MKNKERMKLWGRWSGMLKQQSRKEDYIGVVLEDSKRAKESLHWIKEEIEVEGYGLKRLWMVWRGSVNVVDVFNVVDVLEGLIWKVRCGYNYVSSLFLSQMKH